MTRFVSFRHPELDSGSRFCKNSIFLKYTIKYGTLANSAIENILLSNGTKLLIVDMQEATYMDNRYNTLLPTTNNNIHCNNKKYNPLHIFTSLLNNIDLSQNKIVNRKEVDNIKNYFYLFSNDIWDVDIKNRNLLKEVA